MSSDIPNLYQKSKNLEKKLRAVQNQLCASFYRMIRTNKYALAYMVFCSHYKILCSKYNLSSIAGGRSEIHFNDFLS